MSLIKRKNATIFLFINAFLWGSSYVWSKMLLNYLPRFSILFLCSLGGLISTIIIFNKSIKRITIKEVCNGAFLSLFSILSNTCFMFALQYTSSSNAAFIVQTSVVIVPIIMTLVDKKIPQKKVVISSIIALSGLFILTSDPVNFRLNIGDIFAFGNAIFFSLFLVGLNISSKKNDPVNFTFVYHTINTIAFLALAVTSELSLINYKGLLNLSFLALLAISVFVTIFTILIQSTALKYVRPEKATLVYTLEPVTTMLVGYIFIGESIGGLRPIIGGIMIILSVFCSIYYPKAKLFVHDEKSRLKTILPY